MLKELFTLDDLYVSDFISEGESPRAGKFEMKLMFDEETKCVRLEKMVPPEAMYGKYWYRSGTNLTMKKELQNKFFKNNLSELKIGYENIKLND